MKSAAAIQQFPRRIFCSWILTLARISAPLTAAEPAGTLIPQEKFPARVHVAEDYETDIERRWWMAGTPETKDLPEKRGLRACRASLTHDFDRQMGDQSKQYKAVIFNPVPGPPMGPDTRLSFRYKLIGASEMRVQIYSLTNNYHRRLTLTGLPQNVWSEGTVDMTQLRRPDGGGGPLATDERIDDIQFYIDPAADLLIDDILLYDPAPKESTRPFPNRVIFTAWFDTGKQGKEWPGEFEIVTHEKPRTWKYARSVKRPDGSGVLAVSLRGARRLSPSVSLDFHYRLEGTETFEIELLIGGKPIDYRRRLLEPGGGPKWGPAQCQYSFPEDASDRIDEIRFTVPPGGTISIDDLLLFEPLYDELPGR
jgi:hypothetical protein